MYIGTNDFDIANAKRIQKHRIRGTIDNIPFIGRNILGGSMTITNQCSDTTDAKIGAVFVGKLTVTFLKNLSVTPTTWRGRVISPVFGLCIDEDDDSFEEFALGRFTVSEATITADGVSVVAYDDMSKFDVNVPTDFLVSGYFYDIAVALCQTCGVTFGMTEQEVRALPNGNQPLGLYTPNDCQTYRDVIYWMSQTIGGFATIDRFGRLVFRSYYGRSAALLDMTEAERVTGASFSDFSTDFGSVVFENADGTSERVGSSGVGATYFVGFNPFVQYGTIEARAILRKNIFAAVSAMKFVPFKVEFMSAPVFDLGDVLEFSGGIIQGNNKIGVVQSITYQMNRGTIISGFGSNPALQNVVTDQEKANKAARRSDQNSEIVYRDYMNGVPISVTLDPVKVVDIYFTTNKVTDVDVWHEIQLQTTRAAGSTEMTVQAVYYLDGEEKLRKPIETFGDDAFHLLDLHCFEHIEDVGSHRWQVFLIADGGSAAIRANDAIAVLKGQGISKADGWTGVIILDDDIVSPWMMMTVPGMTDTVSVTLTTPEIITLSDVIAPPLMGMSVGTYTDDVDVVLYTPLFRLVSEDREYNLTDETGDYNVTSG